MLKRLSVFAVMLPMIFCATSVFAKGNNIIKMNTDIEVEKSMVADDVVAIGGNVLISGRVEKNVIAIGGSVTLGPKSYVGEEVVVIGGDITKDPTAEVRGRITQVYVPRFLPSFKNFLKGGWLALWATISILVLIGFLGLAILLIALIPEYIGTVVSALERSFISMLLWGVLWLILIIPIAALLAISIVGIILIPLEILLVVLAYIIGYIASALFVGKHIFLSFRKASPPFIDVILGIFVLFLIGFVPFVGAFIKALFLIAGFGAVLTTRFGAVK